LSPTTVVSGVYFSVQLLFSDAQVSPDCAVACLPVTSYQLWRCRRDTTLRYALSTDTIFMSEQYAQKSDAVTTGTIATDSSATDKPQHCDTYLMRAVAVVSQHVALPSRLQPVLHRQQATIVSYW